jgi:protein-tyrosine phosphatase
MIDLHCHILSGLDDGPKTLDLSLAMARHGVRLCVATPHIHPGCYDNDYDAIQTAYQSFQLALAEKGIALQLRMAAEVRVDAHLPSLVGARKRPFIRTWEGRSALLIEFPHGHLPADSETLIPCLLNQGILPVIAPPERHRVFVRQPAKLVPFLELGCLPQVTAASLAGLFGPDIRRYAISLLRQGCVTFMASDAHNLEKRAPDMQPALTCLRALIGEDNACGLVDGNPRKLLGLGEI